MGSTSNTIDRTEQNRPGGQREDAREVDDISAGEYVAEDDRARPYGYCAVPHHAARPSLRDRARQVRRGGRSYGGDDGN